ncbi:hypothetical protein EDC01DRAFT_756616 [Geopyxis carbonaria]|nr:hypothetical protein EDC01DRAFT_756616 [Geopyxis carbonaria]
MESSSYRPSVGQSKVRRGGNFYQRSNLSDASLDSSALLDHRDQQSMKPRRASTTTFGPVSYYISSPSVPASHCRQKPIEPDRIVGNDGTADDEAFSETDPLIYSQQTDERTSLFSRKGKRSRPSTSGSGSKCSWLQPRPSDTREYGSVNFPPSVPTSPKLGPNRSRTVPSEVERDDLNSSSRNRRRDFDTIINIDDEDETRQYVFASSTSPQEAGRTAGRPEEDVCFPVDDGLIDEEVATLHGDRYNSGRPRGREWPDFSVLAEWSREEKEERSEGIRAKKLPEPVYVAGRLRPPVRSPWYRDENDAPYRFTYFNEDLPATIHSHTISELLQPGQTFRDLFKPEPRLLDDSSDDGDPQNIDMRSTKTPDDDYSESKYTSPKIGPRPTFWLDVFQPTDAEMKVISKSFGIHPLTVEDIMMQEAREKVELFRTYYLVSYRTFEQDSSNEDFMEPVNFYAVVFRDGVISFHFSMTPHPANVRRRIRQLKDYITVSADWISYALIDDITDAFGPLIQSLETEVDDIDDAILRMHLGPDDGEMLKRVGDSRKNVMGLYRLMGNKADVIKGFAKRCNQQWDVAPKTEIGLYLGDIQDHIITMVSNLNHMEKILSRSHSNYLAQINIKMNERQEQTADVLGRLTVLGTIVLPMNIITGLWGMNVVVPGQEIQSLDWFWCITAGLVVFGFLCYFIAKRVYKIM